MASEGLGPRTGGYSVGYISEILHDVVTDSSYYTYSIHRGFIAAG